MPSKTKRYCMKCGKIATQGAFCDEHVPRRDYRAENERRGTKQYDQWEKTKLWQRKRARQLQREPLCRACVREGIYDQQAQEVDHIIPHRGDWQIFIDDNNLQSLCKRHHSMKTARENGRGHIPHPLNKKE